MPRAAAPPGQQQIVKHGRVGVAAAQSPPVIGYRRFFSMFQSIVAPSAD